MTKDTLLNFVETLPPLPESIQKIEQLFAQSQYPNNSELVAIISHDPALMADILALCNAPLFGFSRTIESIQQAVILFGAPKIRKMALKSAIFSSFTIDMSSYKLSNDRFVALCSFQSDLAYQWYKNIDTKKAKQLIPLAFLMQTGSIVIARVIADNQESDNFYNHITQYSVDEAEQHFCKMTTLEVDSVLFEHWNLSELFTKTMMELKNPEPSTPPEIQNFAFVLKVVLHVINLKEQFSNEGIEQAKKLISAKGLDEKSFETAIQEIQERFEALK